MASGEKPVGVPSLAAVGFVLLAAGTMPACSGGTEGPSTNDLGPGPAEPTSPLGSGSACWTCGDVLDAIGSGEIDGTLCDDTDDLLEDLGRCACDRCAVTCGPVCGQGDDRIGASCWSCMSASCGSTIAACRNQ